MKDSMLHLKRDNLYYYEIQGTMAIVNKQNRETSNKKIEIYSNTY